MITLDAVLTAPATLAVGATLLHFLWQGAVIGAVLAALLRFGRPTASTRYACSARARAWCHSRGSRSKAAGARPSSSFR